MHVADFLELLDDGRSSAFSVEKKNIYIEEKSAFSPLVRIRICVIARLRQIAGFVLSTWIFYPFDILASPLPHEGVMPPC